MNLKIKRVTEIIATALLFTSSFIFWSWCQKGCLYYQEWFQIFIGTPDYFWNLAKVPGGFAAWVARFLMQFYCINWAGGLVCALTPVGIQLLVYLISGKRTLVSYAFSFIPAAAFWISMCKDDAFLVPEISALLCLIFAYIIIKLTNNAGRHLSAVLKILCTPLVWHLCGPFAFLFVAATFFAAPRGEYATLAIQVAILAICPLFASLLCHYTSNLLAYGVYYSKSLFLRPTLFWTAAIICLIIMSLSRLDIKENIILSAGIFVTVCVLTILGVRHYSNFKLGRLMEYSQMVNLQQWKKLIEKTKATPVTYENVHIETGKGAKWSINDTYTLMYSCSALAYAKQGCLIENLFEKFCPGEEGLFPKYDKNQPLKNMIASDVYYHLSMTSQSQELMFEAKETIPDYQKSTRAYRRLANTNSINGNYTVSRKYLDELSHTMFHSSFADSFDDNCPQLDSLRKFRYEGRHYSFNYEMLESELTDLVLQHPENKMAAQYLTALILLKKDLKYLSYVMNLIYPKQATTKIPDVIQQAAVIHLVSKEDFDGKLPAFISATNVEKGQAFIEEYEKLPTLSVKKQISSIKDLRRRYGNTYYFFYYLQ